MGYWWPPSPDVFDPAPRPLNWTLVDGQPYPSIEDQEIFGIGQGQFPNERTIEGLPYASATLVLGGRAYNKPYVSPAFLREGVSEAKRLETYRYLIANRAPEDPPTGGLAADTYDPATGTIFINYWDFSDIVPKRKQETLIPWAGKVNISISQYTPGKGWEPEGGDLEKDLVNALPDIIKAFGAVTTAFIGMVSGIPALAMAWNAVLNAAQKPMMGQPLDMGEMAAATGGFLAAGDYGGAMADLSKSLKFGQAFQGTIGQKAADEIANFGHEVSPYFEKVKKVGEQFAANFPHIDLNGVASGAIPPEVLHAADNAKKGLANFDLDSFKKAGKAFFTALSNDVVYSIRKGATDKSTFDTAYATMQAEQTKRNLVSEVSSDILPSFSQWNREHAILGTQSGAVSQGSMPSAIAHNVDPKMADLISYIRQLEMRYGI